MSGNIYFFLSLSLSILISLYNTQFPFLPRNEECSSKKYCVHFTLGKTITPLAIKYNHPSRRKWDERTRCFSRVNDAWMRKFGSEIGSLSYPTWIARASTFHHVSPRRESRLDHLRGYALFFTRRRAVNATFGHSTDNAKKWSATVIDIWIR